MHIYYDEHCPRCVRWAACVRWFGSLRVVCLGLHAEAPWALGVDPIRARWEMPSIDCTSIDCTSIDSTSISSRDCVRYGFDTLYQLTLRIPALYVLVPLAWVLRYTGLGGYWYRLVARRRVRCVEGCST